VNVKIKIHEKQDCVRKEPAALCVNLYCSGYRVKGKVIRVLKSPGYEDVLTEWRHGSTHF